MFDIDSLLDPLEMGGQGSTIGLARMWRRCAACLVAGLLGFGQRGLDILKGQFELVRIKLFGSAAKPVALESVDDRLQTFRTGLEMLECFQLASLLEDERAQRFNVIRQVGIHQHGGSESGEKSLVNRQFAGQWACGHHARGASPDLPARPPIAPMSGA